jgi:CSLREA domain-containing protein
MNQIPRKLLGAVFPTMLLTILLASASTAQAATFTVNSLADTGDATPDGACDDGSGNCTLREAIEEANALPGDDTINFNLAGAGPHTIQLDSAFPNLSESVDILNTSGESITVRGEGAVDPYRIFTINQDQTVNISNLTITNGHVVTAGGGIHSFHGTLMLTGCTVSGNSAGEGGGIYNFGPLTLLNSTISGNTAVASGGGISTERQTLNIMNSTISGNTAGGFGGGIINLFGGGAITNSTISGNSAGGHGGGIYMDESLLTLTSVSVTNNRADSDGDGFGVGGGMRNRGFSPLLQNSIVAGNFNGASPGTTADDIVGLVNPTSSYNLIGTGDSGGLTDGTNGNQVGVANPGLGPLASNGGPTETHALLPTSPAIDKGNSFGLTTDQRGSPRPVDIASIPNAVGGDGSDIGAFELLTQPTNKDQCKDDGWQGLFRADGTPFKNQGDCIQYVNTGK